MKICVLVNSGGRTVARLGGPEAARERLMAALATLHPIASDLTFASGSDLADFALRAREAAQCGDYAAIVAGGGDGSVGTVAGLLGDTDIPLGVLPLGTLNHFAKDLGIPTDLEGALAVIANGVAKTVDVAEVNDRIFVNNSSIGLYPEMVAERESKLAGRSKLIATPVACFRALRRFPRRGVQIVAEGCAAIHRTPCLFVGNNEYGVDLPTLGKRPRLDAGELCVYVARARSPAGMLWLAFRTAFGGVDAVRDLEMLQTGSLEVVSRRRRLRVALDGEVHVLRPPLRYRTRPKALRVLVSPLEDVHTPDLAPEERANEPSAV